MSKSVEAFRTISEVADELDVQKHVLRFWEVKFPQIRPMKRGGGRRYYRPEDMVLLRGIQHLLHAEGYTIKGVQKILREHGVEQVKAHGSEKVELAPAKTSGAQTAKNPSAGGGRVRALPKSGPQGTVPKSIPAVSPHRTAIENAIRDLVACRALLGATKSTQKTAHRPRAVRAASR